MPFLEHRALLLKGMLGAKQISIRLISLTMCVEEGARVCFECFFFSLVERDEHFSFLQ